MALKIVSGQHFSDPIPTMVHKFMISTFLLKDCMVESKRHPEGVSFLFGYPGERKEDCESQDTHAGGADSSWKVPIDRGWLLTKLAVDQ